MTAPPLLEASALSMWRGERCLFQDLDLRVEPGRALHVRGPNGCGKTTLLRILCGLVSPDSGDLQVPDSGEESPPLRARVAYLGHHDGVKLELDVVENLRFALALAGVTTAIDPAPLLERLDLTAQARLPARQLSAGQRRRLALGRVLASERPLWILDEPFTSLDTAGCALLEGLLRDALLAGTGLVFSSHQPCDLDPARLDALDLAAHGPGAATP